MEPYIITRCNEWVLLGLGVYRQWYHEWELPAYAPYAWLRAHDIAMDVCWSSYAPSVDCLCDRILLDVVRRL